MYICLGILYAHLLKTTAVPFPRPSESEVRRMIDEVDADGFGAWVKASKPLRWGSNDGMFDGKMMRNMT